MPRFYFFLSILLMSHFSSFSQDSVNDYKYIVVPNQYEFLNEPDQYQLNSLTAFLFNKYGYTAFLNNEKFPSDLRNNGCLALTVDVAKESNLLKTKLRIDLKDCSGTVIISSQMGESREKKYATAYNLALRDAFKTFQNLDYNYEPNAAVLAKSRDQKSADEIAKEQAEIVRLKEEIKTLKEEKVKSVEVKMPKEPVTLEEPRIVKAKEEITLAEPDTPSLKNEVLYAQSIDNGFQLVDSTPKVIMIIYPTGAADVFTVKGKNAIVFKKDNQWFYSENDGVKVNESPLNIKF